VKFISLHALLQVLRGRRCWAFRAAMATDAPIEAGPNLRLLSFDWQTGAAFQLVARWPLPFLECRFDRAYRCSLPVEVLSCFAARASGADDAAL
jgi:hypothetical protein